MRIGPFLLAATLAAGLTACSGTPAPPPETGTGPAPTTDSAPATDPTATTAPAPPEPATAFGVPAEVSLADIAGAPATTNCFSLVYTDDPGVRWTALPDTCGGEPNWTLQDTHTIPEVPVGSIREGSYKDMDAAAELTTDQGLPAVTWRAPVWMATNEYTQWEEWVGVVTVAPSEELGTTGTVFVMVQAKIEGEEGAPDVAREDFDAAVAALVVGP